MERLRCMIYPLIGAGLVLSAAKSSFNDISRFDLVISELYPDPDSKSPIPASEFVEVYNRSGTTVNLRGIKLTDGTSTATVNTDLELAADSFLILCSVSNASKFTLVGKTLGLSGFPSLNNDGDHIKLLNSYGQLIHSVAYDLSWYKSEIAKQGGYTLEMIDTENACGAESNWTTSVDVAGGTPGRMNSVNASNPDDQGPSLSTIEIIDSNKIIVYFDEAVDSVAGVSIGNYRFDDPGLKLSSLYTDEAYSKRFELSFDDALKPDKTYSLTVSSVADCSGNSIGSQNTLAFGLPVKPVTGDLVINELLFNPPPGGVDYVEIYHNGKSVIDIGKINLAGKNGLGTMGGMTSIGTAGRLLFPGQYLLLTENKGWLAKNYVVRDQAAVNELKSLPSMPDDKGYVCILDAGGNIIDEVAYSEKWHFALLNSRDGVALERIDYSVTGNKADNWTSAASAAGFGTPGYQNSQFRADLLAAGEFNIEPKVFSPNNDGINDIAGMAYQVPEPGYMGSITIFDASGRPVRYLLKSGLLGLKGTVNWDGLDEKLQRLPMGTYVVLMEMFNLKGKVKKMKKVVVLAR
ncbi:MAG: lamin tail domain-containing protein [Flavitalea sp.]